MIIISPSAIIISTRFLFKQVFVLTNNNRTGFRNDLRLGVDNGLGTNRDITCQRRKLSNSQISFTLLFAVYHFSEYRYRIKQKRAAVKKVKKIVVTSQLGLVADNRSCSNLDAGPAPSH
jgi:hypothetical protein